MGLTFDTEVIAGRSTLYPARWTERVDGGAMLATSTRSRLVSSVSGEPHSSWGKARPVWEPTLPRLSGGSSLISEAKNSVLRNNRSFRRGHSGRSSGRTRRSLEVSLPGAFLGGHLARNQSRRDPDDRKGGNQGRAEPVPLHLSGNRRSCKVIDRRGFARGPPVTSAGHRRRLNGASTTRGAPEDVRGCPTLLRRIRFVTAGSSRVLVGVSIVAAAAGGVLVASILWEGV